MQASRLHPGKAMSTLGQDLNDGEIMDQDELDQNQAVISTDIIDHQVTFGV